MVVENCHLLKNINFEFILFHHCTLMGHCSLAIAFLVDLLLLIFEADRFNLLILMH